MPFVDGLYTFLAGTAGITALTGAGATARIYPLIIPGNAIGVALAATLAYGQTGRQDIEALRGSGQKKTEFEFLSMAETHSAAHALNDALETALSNFSGSMGAYTCSYARLQESSDDAMADQGVYIVTSRYLITHN